MQKHSLLADLVDIRDQIARDQETSREQLQHRDRKIGLENDRPLSAGVIRLRRWINVIREQEGLSDSQVSSGSKAQQTINIVVTLLWLLGGICGWILTQTVLFYDGNQPVNIISALLVLVCSQLFTLLLLLVFSLLGLPGVLRSLSVFNPAVLLLGLLKRINSDRLEALSKLISSTDITGTAALRQRLIVYLAQHFTVALNLGIIAALLYLVAVSDLAFGWNTTLDVDTHSVASWFKGISWPWHSVVPAAVPDLQLVETSRYYRLQGQLRNGDWQAEQLGSWWIYILMCVLVYGLLPRLLALIISGVQYDRAVSGAMTSASGANQILARMSSPLVSTIAEGEDDSAITKNVRPPLTKRQSGRDLPCLVIEWSEARSNTDKMTAVGIEPLQFFSAGGHQTLAEDRNIVVHISSHNPQGVAVVVKSWEPPMLEFLDFLRSLRERLDRACPLIVLLTAISGERVEAHQLESWEASLADLSDPALYVEPL